MTDCSSILHISNFSQGDLNEKQLVYLCLFHVYARLELAGSGHAMSTNVVTRQRHPFAASWRGFLQERIHHGKVNDVALRAQIKPSYLSHMRAGYVPGQHLVERIGAAVGDVNAAFKAAGYAFSTKNEQRAFRKKPTKWQWRLAAGRMGKGVASQVAGQILSAMSLTAYMTARDVANNLGMDPSAVSSHLGRLLTLKAVERRIIPGSVWEVAPTPAPTPLERATSATAAMAKHVTPPLGGTRTPPILAFSGPDGKTEVFARPDVTPSGRLSEDQTYSLADLVAVDPEPSPLEKLYDKICQARPATVGRKDDGGKPPLQDLFKYIPATTLGAVAEVMAYGADEYGERNWEDSGLSKERILGAVLRHAADDLRGVNVDLKSGKLHLAHAAASALMALTKEMEKQ